MNLLNDYGDIDLNAIKDVYVDETYHISYINEALHILGEEEILTFAACKQYNFPSSTAFYGPFKTLLFVMNEVLVVGVNESNVYNPVFIRIKDKKNLHLDNLSSEAKEKIATKYNSYISRLEDKLQKTFEETING